MVLFAMPRDSLIKVQGDWMAITQLVSNIWDRAASMHHERQARVCHQNKVGIRHGLACCARESSGQSERLPQWFENHCWRIMGEIVFPAKYCIPPAIPRSLFLPTHLLRQPFLPAAVLRFLLLLPLVTCWGVKINASPSHGSHYM